MILSIIVPIVITLVIILVINRLTEAPKLCSSVIESDLDKVHSKTTKECFVPYNSSKITNVKDSTITKDQKYLESVFDSIIEKDQDKISLDDFAPFRESVPANDQAKMYLNTILARINALTGRKYHILDIQAISHNISYDTKTLQLVDKWGAELFIQDTQSQEVHASATNIVVEFYTYRERMMVTKLHFVTDFFNKEPLVGGINKYDLNFEIQNPFSLLQPFKTTDDKVLPNISDSDAIIVRHHEQLRKPNYRCFQENGDSDATITQNQCYVQGGHWDKPPAADEECPFYLANKHYPNRLGGIDKNSKQCEMPIGTKAVGYRFISNDPAHKPWCYNCHIGNDGMPGSIGPCCEEQRNMELYPELGGKPDYAFPGDPLERGQNWSMLSERGLNWMAHPTKIKDVVNPKQKQPIFSSFIGV